jgi:hypothetical protein
VAVAEEEAVVAEAAATLAPEAGVEAGTSAVEVAAEAERISGVAVGAAAHTFPRRAQLHTGRSMCSAPVVRMRITAQR